MKRYLCILFLVAILLGGCNVSQSSPQSTDLQLADNGKANFTLVVSDQSETASSLGKSLLVALRTVIGADVTYVTADRQPDPGAEVCEILLGPMDRPQSQAVLATISDPTGYKICVDGKKVIIIAGSDEALQNAVDVFMKEILLWNNKNDYTANPQLTIRADLQLTGNIEKAKEPLTQEQMDAVYGPILDGLFTGKTTQKIVKNAVGQSFAMHFPDMIYLNGTYYAYYICYATETQKGGVGLATSTDGFTWKNQGCVIQPDEDYDRNGAYFAGVWLDDDGTYYLVYECKGDAQSQYGTLENVALATSTDGVHWTKEGVILWHTDSIPWLRVNVGTPDLYKVGDMWYLTFHGYDGTDCQIGLAYGTDIRNLNICPDPIIPTEDGTLWSGTTGRRDIIYIDGYYYMVYEISTDQNPGYVNANWTHMFARSRDMLTWEVTSGPLMTQDAAGFGYDGPCWVLEDGHLYVYIRSEVWTMVTELTLE